MKWIAEMSDGVDPSPRSRNLQTRRTYSLYWRKTASSIYNTVLTNRCFLRLACFGAGFDLAGGWNDWECHFVARACEDSSISDRVPTLSPPTEEIETRIRKITIMLWSSKYYLTPELIRRPRSLTWFNYLGGVTRILVEIGGYKTLSEKWKTFWCVKSACRYSASMLWRKNALLRGRFSESMFGGLLYLIQKSVSIRESITHHNPEWLGSHLCQCK